MYRRALEASRSPWPECSIAIFRFGRPSIDITQGCSWLFYTRRLFLLSADLFVSSSTGDNRRLKTSVSIDLESQLADLINIGFSDEGVFCFIPGFEFPPDRVKR